MPLGLIAGIGFVVILLIAIVFVASRYDEDRDPLEDRLGEYVTAEQTTANLEEIEMSVPFTQRVIVPIVQGIANFVKQFAPEETIQKAEQQIRLAGSPDGLTPQILYASRFVAMVFMGGAIGLVMVITGQRALFVILAFVGGGAVGYYMPQLYLRSKIDSRKEEIIKYLPDALDLMSICVEAGLTFDGAMKRVYDKWDNELGLAFGRVVHELQLGKSRREALRAMDESTGVPDMTTFCGAIIQADQLGVSITKVLKIQSEQMRIKRRQRAQEKAQQAPVKMVIPMVIFIFPTIWIVLLGPAGIQLIQQFLGW